MFRECRWICGTFPALPALGACSLAGRASPAPEPNPGSRLCCTVRRDLPPSLWASSPRLDLCRQLWAAGDRGVSVGWLRRACMASLHAGAAGPAACWRSAGQPQVCGFTLMLKGLRFIGVLFICFSKDNSLQTCLHPGMWGKAGRGAQCSPAAFPTACCSPSRGARPVPLPGLPRGWQGKPGALGHRQQSNGPRLSPSASEIPSSLAALCGWESWPGAAMGAPSLPQSQGMPEPVEGARRKLWQWVTCQGWKGTVLPHVFLQPPGLLLCTRDGQ